MKKRITPPALAAQGISLSEESVAPTSNANPHRCACFGGFCWRNLCHSKTPKEATTLTRPIADATPKGVTAPRVRSFRPGLSVWRIDGSHEAGPLPPGRIPPKPVK